jgi:hypothetical protein
MASDMVGFQWRVAAHGHHWKQAWVWLSDIGHNVFDPARGRYTDEAEWVLTENLTTGHILKIRQYSPLRMYPGLYRNFAELPHDDLEALLSFANEYGLLGIERPLSLEHQTEPTDYPEIMGESHEDWIKEIHAMRRAVQIWDMIQERQVNKLKHHIQLRETGWCYDSHPDLPRTGIEAFPTSPPGRSGTLIQPVGDLFKPGDVLMPASFLDQREVGKERVSSFAV